MTVPNGKEYYCYNCFHSFTIKNKLKPHGNVCKNHTFCTIKLRNEDNKILKNNQGEKSIEEATFRIFTDLGCLAIQPIQSNINNKTKQTHLQVVTHY